MDDLRLLQQIGQETPPATPEQLASARGRLLAAMTATSPAPTTIRRSNRRSWRLVLSGMVAAGVAAAVTSVVVLAPDQFGGDAPVARADASHVLRNAAAVSLRMPDLTPRSDQLIYQRTQNRQSTRESWMSVDGTRDGLVRETSAAGTTETVIPGCRNGRMAAVKGGQVVPGRTEQCTPEPAYRSDLPTDAAAMRTYLAGHRSGEAGDVNAAGKDVLFLAESYLRPQTRAALYEAAAAVPGLRAVENVTDGAGRPGIGIAWPSTNGAEQMVLVFHRETYAYLGTSRYTAVIAHTVVDEVGQTG
ncbi:CU044_5270 family protein [Micromonospora sp. NPDC052213]|uniref:CU044_5270 family protein n=1 Tax=Micromonospora sp. NPDC052213 TaxID=3155812 RepID=UPI0034332BCB